MWNSRLISQLLPALLFILCFTGCKKQEEKPAGTQKPTNDSVPELVVLYDDHHEWTYNLSMYEVNLRQYTPEGTIEAFSAHLERLRDMGVGILWFMPVHPIGEENRLGSLGSYYSVKDYRAINPEYGTLGDFKNLVYEAHELGMYVIIDWVANHTSWDNELTLTYPDFYDTDESGNFQPPPGTNWSDVIELDYDNPALRDYMIETLKFWLLETGIDGFRFDAVDFVPQSFWQEAITELKAYKPDVFLLAESDGLQYHNMGFDMDYCWALQGWGSGLMRRIYEGSAGVSDMYQFLSTEAASYMPDKYHLYYTSNHDENSWEGTVFEQLGDSYEAFAVLTATLYGMPLVYSGQEAGLNTRLAFFDKHPIPWGDYPYEAFYSTLLNLKQEQEALWNATAGGYPEVIDVSNPAQIFAYKREKDLSSISVYINLTDSLAGFEIESLADTGRYHDVFADEEVELRTDSLYSLPVWGFKILLGK